MSMDDEALTAEQLASVAAEGEGDDAGEGEGEGAEGEGQDQEQDDGEGEGAKDTKGAAGEAGKGDPTEIENLAAEMGWVPKDQFRGDPDKWVEPAVFIRQGDTILRTTLHRQDGKITDLTTTMEEFRDHYKKVQQRADDRAMADLKAEQRAAVEEGDTEAFDEAGKKIDELVKDAPDPAKKPAKGAATNPDDDPNYKAFSTANPWYATKKNYEMRAYANQIAPEVAADYQGAAFYDKIAEEVRAKFPDKFKNAARGKPSRVEGSGSMRPAGGNGRGYDNLPPEAKAACNKFVAQKLLTRDDYVRDYEWE